MNNVVATWEDEDNNRHIQYRVDYAIENGQVEIADVTPNKVTFVCPESNTVTRTLGVHTTGGRRVLHATLQIAGQIANIASEIADREGLLVSA